MIWLIAPILIQDWLSAAYNGLWLDKLGNAFVIDEPYSVWGTFDGRHYCAYNIEPADKGFAGEFQDATSMVVGWTQKPSAKGQEAALRALVQDYPYDPGQSAPSEIPYIPPPKDPADSGHLRIDPGATRTALKLSWTTSDNKVVYADAITFVGKASAISMNGTFRAGDLTITLSEDGAAARRSFDGTLSLNGKQYVLHGNRAWTRAALTLSTPSNPDVIARGWIEWAPTAKFARMLLKGYTGPTDQIEVSIDLVSAEYPDGIHKMLLRG